MRRRPCASRRVSDRKVTVHMRRLDTWIAATALALLGACSGAAAEVEDPGLSEAREPATTNEGVAPVGGRQEPSAGLQPASSRTFADPGQAPFERVPEGQVAELCGLSVELLEAADDALGFAYAVVRRGRLCWEYYPEAAPQQGSVQENYSATKTLAAAAFGRVVGLSQALQAAGPRTGPVSDEDLATDWLDGVSYNGEARIAHVLAMVAHEESLVFGSKLQRYDGDGTEQINSLGVIAENVMAQAPEFFGSRDLGEIARSDIFEPLGMTPSRWSGENLGFSWESNLRDMARLGLLLLHDGFYGGEQILHPDWVYKMTHPAFEDGNTSYGYLTWLTAAYNYNMGGILDYARFSGPMYRCQPMSLWREYPHGLSRASDCHYDGKFPCVQRFDVGVWGAMGWGGQIINGHKGLDLVLVTRDAGDPAAMDVAWKQVMPALVAQDPVFAGDTSAFCEAYAAGDYAPDLAVAPR